MLELLNTSKIGLKKKVLILVIAAFCAANVMAQDFTMQEQESVFVKEYYEYIKKYQRKWHKKAVRKSNGSIHENDTLLYIPCLYLKKEIVKQWDYKNYNTNEQFACWKNFSFKKGELHGVMTKENGMWKEFYYYSKWDGMERFYSSRYPELLEFANKLELEGVFLLNAISGYFVIIDGRIKFYGLIEGCSYSIIGTQKDAIGSLKAAFAENTFFPIHEGQIYHGKRFARLRFFEKAFSK